jgi:hypothetical protein
MPDAGWIVPGGLFEQSNTRIANSEFRSDFRYRYSDVRVFNNSLVVFSYTEFHGGTRELHGESNPYPSVLSVFQKNVTLALRRGVNVASLREKRFFHEDHDEDTRITRIMPSRPPSLVPRHPDHLTSDLISDIVVRMFEYSIIASLSFLTRSFTEEQGCCTERAIRTHPFYPCSKKM